ncbi:MAG: phage exclusion protein Lit family protein [Serratia liquefaciens]|nr:phage exclusion protein Lit family protein [Serratia liquefaciens]
MTLRKMPADFPLSRLEGSLIKCVNNINTSRAESHPEFTVCFDDSNAFSFSVSVSKKMIYLPLSSLYYVWAVSCASWGIYKKYQESNTNLIAVTESDIQTEVNLIKGAKANISTSLSTGNFSLHEYAIADETLKVGDELFLCAMAWIMLHEIGHIKLNHTDDELSLSSQEEVDADSFATDFVFDENTIPQEFTKRFSGSLLALTIILNNDVTDEGGERTHPHATARIEHMFNRSRCDDERSVAIVFPLLMYFYFDKKGVPPTFDESDDKDYIDYVFELLLQYVRD